MCLAQFDSESSRAMGMSWFTAAPGDETQVLAVCRRCMTWQRLDRESGGCPLASHRT